MQDDLSITDILYAYSQGYFPMADGRESDEFAWYDPPRRGQLSIDSLHIPRRLRETILKFPFDIRVDSDFTGVIDGCAAAAKGRTETWINRGIRDIFIALADEGYAHSVEAWHEGKLVGGIYGLALGGAFMGESMFSRATDASKICLVHLCARLWAGGFTVFDTQFVNAHLKQFGVYEIPRAEYREILQKALTIPAEFSAGKADEPTLIHNYITKSNILR